MNEPIKFPISRRDLDKGVLDNSAAKLRAMATPEMPVEFSKKLIANLLGYNDFDEIERRSPSFEFRVTPDPFKRLVCASVVFRAHKIMRISVSESFEFVKHLELKNYEFLKFKSRYVKYDPYINVTKKELIAWVNSEKSSKPMRIHFQHCEHPGHHDKPA